jgi:hypothetical protein
VLGEVVTLLVSQRLLSRKTLEACVLLSFGAKRNSYFASTSRRRVDELEHLPTVLSCRLEVAGGHELRQV